MRTANFLNSAKHIGTGLSFVVFPILFVFAFLASDGFPLEVTIVAPGAIRVELTDMSDGLPAIPCAPPPVRPAHTMPSTGVTWDGIIVRDIVHIND